MRFMQDRRCLHELFFLYDGIKRVQRQEQIKNKKACYHKSNRLTQTVVQSAGLEPARAQCSLDP